jgi:chorismate dehydratase
MPTPRISASSYSNTAPLIWSFLYGSNRGKYELILDNAPSRSAELLATDRVDAALVPVVEYHRIENVLIVPDVCVGAREKVRSVCLVTKGKDLRAVKTVSLDASSRTSVALTKIIFREFLNVEPIYKISNPNLDEMLSASDCALLIGDPALMIADSKADDEGQRTKDKGQFRKFDLAEVWREFTGFGFVFAMWMTLGEHRETAQNIDFAAARDEGLQHLEEIISNYETEIQLSHEDFKKYLSENISYSIDDSMQKGLELYFYLAAKNNLIEGNRELKFI